MLSWWENVNDRKCKIKFIDNGTSVRYHIFIKTVGDRIYEHTDFWNEKEF